MTKTPHTNAISNSDNYMDLNGKTYAITGPTHGMGQYAAFQLAKRGANLILLCRNMEKGRSIKKKLIKYGTQINVVEADLRSLKSTGDAASRTLDLGCKLDVLINNAAVLNKYHRLSADGFEETFAVNYLAHFLLTMKLLPLIKSTQAGRIVHVASEAYTRVNSLSLDDYNWEKRPFVPFAVYGHSKLAVLLFNQHLARLLIDSNTTSNAVHPGVVATGFGAIGWRVKIVNKATALFTTPAKGALTIINLATNPALTNQNGMYFNEYTPTLPKPYASDSALASQLWDLSKSLLSDKKLL